MELSDNTIKILFLFLPGIITISLIREITEDKEKKIYTYFLNAFIYGVLSYTILSLFQLKSSTALYKLINDSENISVSDVMFACMISFLVSIVVSIINTKEMLHKITRKIHITNKFSDESLLSHVLIMTKK